MRETMTEADAALSFVAEIARASAAQPAGTSAEDIDEGAEFDRHCRRLGLEPTEERYDLACDVGLALLELAGGDATAAADLAGRVSTDELDDRLEARGWRRAFLTQPVGTAGR